MGRHKKEIETVSISSRVTPNIYEIISDLAKSNYQSISAYLRMIIEDHAKSKGIIK